MQALEPLRIADVGLASWNVLGVTGIDHQDLEPPLFQDLEDRSPMDPGRLP
jgi:hypothetical protein